MPIALIIQLIALAFQIILFVYTNRSNKKAAENLKKIETEASERVAEFNELLRKRYSHYN